MPYCNMSDMLVFLTDVADCGLQAARKATLIRFELGPGVVELSGTVSLSRISTSQVGGRTTYQRLPVIINDQVADIYLIL